MLDIHWLILLGVAAGTAGSLVGFGGGIMISPVLAFLGFNPALIASNSLFGTFGNLSGATVTHIVKKRIKYSLGLKLGIMSIPGTIIGAMMADYIESDFFNLMLGGVLVVSAYMLFRGNIKERSGSSMRHMTVMMVMASISAGIVSSFFGIGGGVVVVPFMMLVMGMSMKETAVMSQPALIVIAFVGLVSHVSFGHIEVYQAMALLAGGFGGGLLGVRLSRRLKGRHMRMILSALIFSAAARLIWGFLEEVYSSGLLVLGRMLPS